MDGEVYSIVDQILLVFELNLCATPPPAANAPKTATMTEFGEHAITQFTPPPQEYLMRIRDALFTDVGVDYDVLAAFGVNNLTMEFACGSTLPARLRTFILELTKGNMEDIVDESGYGWDDEERLEDATGEASRYLVRARLRTASWSDTSTSASPSRPTSK